MQTAKTENIDIHKNYNKENSYILLYLYPLLTFFISTVTLYIIFNSFFW